MNTIDTILTRHSTRKYDASQKATTEQIDMILKCAAQAPSAMNKQPWSFIVINQPEVLQAIENVHPYAGFLTQAGTAIIVVGDSQNCWEDFWRVDPILAGQNILLAAHALGLSTCWCGIYPNEQHMANLANILNLPKGQKPMALIALGTEIQKTTPSLRFNPKQVHYNQW